MKTVTCIAQKNTSNQMLADLLPIIYNDLYIIVLYLLYIKLSSLLKYQAKLIKRKTIAMF